MENKATSGVTVIIPTFNTEKYLFEALDSVASQTLGVDKVIVVDDGSTDATSKRMMEYVQHSRLSIDYVRLEQNNGISNARNIGLKAATTEFVAFLDADDIWHPEWVEDHVASLKGNPNALCSYSWFYYVDETGKELKDAVSNISFRSPSGKIFAELLRDNLALRNPGQVMVRSSALNLIGLFDVGLPAGEDWDWFLRIAEIGEIICIPKRLLAIRSHRNNVTKRYLWLFEAQLKFYNKWSHRAGSRTHSFWMLWLSQKMIFSTADYKEKMLAAFNSILDPRVKRKLLASSFGSLNIAMVRGFAYLVFKNIFHPSRYLKLLKKVNKFRKQIWYNNIHENKSKAE